MGGVNMSKYTANNIQSLLRETPNRNRTRGRNCRLRKRPFRLKVAVTKTGLLALLFTPVAIGLTTISEVSTTQMQEEEWIVSKDSQFESPKNFTEVFEEQQAWAIEKARDTLWHFLVTPHSEERVNFVYRPSINRKKIIADSDSLLPLKEPTLTHLRSWSRHVGYASEIVSAFLVSSPTLNQSVVVEVGVDRAGKGHINWSLFKQHVTNDFDKFASEPCGGFSHWYLSIVRTHGLSADSQLDDEWDKFLVSGSNPNRFHEVRVRKDTQLGDALSEFLPWGELKLMRAEMAWKLIDEQRGLEMTISEIIAGNWQGEADRK